MTDFLLVWSALGGLCTLVLGLSAYFHRELQDQEHKLAEVDKEQAVHLAAIETQLASINTTLLDLKKDFRNARQQQS